MAVLLRKWRQQAPLCQIRRAWGSVKKQKQRCGEPDTTPCRSAIIISPSLAWYEKWLRACTASLSGCSLST